MSGKTCTEPECHNLPSFARSAELRRHQKEFHGPLHLCPYCSWPGSKRLSRYKDHVKKYHSATDVVLDVPKGFSEYAVATDKRNNQNQPPPASLFFEQSYTPNFQNYPPAAPQSLSPSSNASNFFQQPTPPQHSLQAPSPLQYYPNIPEGTHYNGDEIVESQGDFTLFYNSQPSPDTQGKYDGNFDYDAAL